MELHKPPTYFRIGSKKVASVVCGLPLFATLFCVFWSVVFDFEAATATHCRVRNYLPSISAAIGGFTPQRYVWRICIALHCAPRFMIALAYYQFHTVVHVGKNNEAYKALAALCSLLHIIENGALVGLSYISSSENRPLHENLFILFLVVSLVYMLLTIITFRWGRMHNGRKMTSLEVRSYRWKVFLLTFSIATAVLAGYIFYRHNKYCEPGVYTLFGCCEYSIVFANIFYHGTAELDFRNYCVSIARGDLLEKEKRSN